MRSLFLVMIMALPICAGCGKPATFTTVGSKVGSAEPPADPNAKEEKHEEMARNDQGAPNEPDKKDQPKAAKQRKIRYTADMRLIVEDFDKAWDGLKAAMKESQTHPAQEEINTSPGSPRSGTWRIRVPVDRLGSFRSAVTKLGDVERNSLQSEDMTAQFYDLQADIENRKAAREALRDLLKETGKKDMKHYLDVWDKLEQISGEINRKEGPLRLWADLTELTTVTVNMREKQKYIPEERAKDREVATFGMRAGKTWSDSWQSFLDFCQWFVLAAIAITPWLPIVLVGGGVFVFFIRRGARETKQAPAAVELVETPKEKTE